jgi:cyclopropane fatty-acyl-phospholipid synthase-like methyltransferase
MSSETITATERAPERARAYWDGTHDLYLASVGTTLQAGRITGGRSMQDSNLWLAAAARLSAGQRVLDAGCGVAGPAIDIARAIPGLRIFGVTVSGRQSETAGRLIREAGLSGRVDVVQADYHALPFADGTFDAVFFLESVGYAASLRQLFSGVGRVLRSSGSLYIKDVFRRATLWSDQERDELAHFDAAYAQQTPTLQECVEAVADAGFTDIRTRDLSSLVSTAHTLRAMFDSTGTLSPFGRLHYRRYACVPVYFAELTARMSRVDAPEDEHANATTSDDRLGEAHRQVRSRP